MIADKFINSSFIELTSICNLSCIFCYNSSGRNSNTEISADDLTKIISFLFSHEVKHFILSGGEPFLHSEFDKVIEVIKNHPDCSFVLITNGTVHNFKAIDKLSKLDNLYVQVSLDGGTDEINSLIRGKGNFHKTKAFIEYLSSKGKKPVVKMVLSKLNISSVEDFIVLNYESGSTPDFGFVNNIGSAKRSWNDIYLTPKDRIHVLKNILSICSKYSLTPKLPLCAADCPLSHENPKAEVLIKPDGSVQPCDVLYDDKFTIGNIFDFNFVSLREKFIYFHGMALKRVNTVYECPTCINRSSCKKGCMAAAYMFHGDLLASDEECEMRRYQTVNFGITDLLKKKLK